MNMETLNKLYLELSQVVTATTAKELALTATIDALRQRAERAEASLQWRPIETAPRDCTHVLVYQPDGRIHVDWCNGKATTAYERKWSGHPTHWMPVPKSPPTAAAGIDTSTKEGE